MSDRATSVSWTFPEPWPTDGRVTLRPLEDADVGPMVDQCRDQESIRWTTVPSPYGAEEATDWIAAQRDRYSARSVCPFVVADAGSGQYCGALDIRMDDQLFLGEVGYALAPWARGKGYMTAALRLAAAWAFDDPTGPQLSVLSWYAMVGNWPSRRAAERAGFRYEGVIRGLHPLRDGGVGRFWRASLVRDEPRTGGQPPVPQLPADE